MEAISAPQAFRDALALSRPDFRSWLRVAPFGLWPLLLVFAAGLVGLGAGLLDGLIATAAALALLGVLWAGGHARHRARLARDPRARVILATEDLRRQFNAVNEHCIVLARRHATGVSLHCGSEPEMLLSEARSLMMTVQGLVQDATERVRVAPPIGRIAGDPLRHRGVRVTNADREQLEGAALRVRQLGEKLDECSQGVSDAATAGSQVIPFARPKKR